ncbi:hypothetical protein M405DRAFT_343650 [Rhizopogon salebrosus TDB-379]|nr:hypothetical protein M405DRAFT_343650 [Rhizopogon salebrosus TDB-379]
MFAGPDQIQVLRPNDPILDFHNGEVDNNYTGVFLMISTSLGLKSSLRDQVSVNMTWNSSGPDSRIVQYHIDVYFVHCSLSNKTALVTIDTQNNSLLNTSTMSISQSSGAWEIYQWTSSKSNSWQGEVG